MKRTYLTSIKGRKRLICFLLPLALAACEKDQAPLDEEPVSQIPENSYEFLTTQRGFFDTLITLIDRSGIAEQLKNEEITFFAPQDYSIKIAMDNLNYDRANRGRSHWTLDSIPDHALDTLLNRYIMKGIIPSDSLEYADGVELTNAYGYAMNGKKISSNASGTVGSGPVIIQYSDKNNSRFIRDWTQSYTQTSDLETSNGMVHILESEHIFGFNSFGTIADPPTQEPFKGTPWPVPGVVEAEDFDIGGQGISYYDVDPGNNGGRYRDSRVDIENSGEGTYSIGWVGNSEWTEYTIEVAESGKYMIEVRTASPTDVGRFQLFLDDQLLADTTGVPNTGGYQNWTNVPLEAELPEGRHVFRFYVAHAEFNFHRFIFTKLEDEEVSGTGIGDGNRIGSGNGTGTGIGNF